MLLISLLCTICCNLYFNDKAYTFFSTFMKGRGIFKQKSNFIDEYNSLGNGLRFVEKEIVPHEKYFGDGDELQKFLTIHTWVTQLRDHKKINILLDVAGVKTILDNIKTNNVEDYVTINKRVLSALYSYLLRLDDMFYNQICY